MTQKQRIAQLEDAIMRISAMNEGFHAVKNIRAWAAEENRETKQIIRNIISEVQ
jgi:virulence-associated protein VapD